MWDGGEHVVPSRWGQPLESFQGFFGEVSVCPFGIHFPFARSLSRLTRVDLRVNVVERCVCDWPPTHHSSHRLSKCRRGRGALIEGKASWMRQMSKPPSPSCLIGSQPSAADFKDCHVGQRLDTRQRRIDSYFETFSPPLTTCSFVDFRPICPYPEPSGLTGGCK